MVRARPTRPDYVVDPDRGRGSVAAKQAAFVDADVHARRADSRAGLRELDAMTEAMPGLTRAGRDRERAIPRETVAPLGHPRMDRQLPGAGVVRVPLSGRQRSRRRVARTRTEAHLPLVQLRAEHDLVTSPQTWDQLNQALSDHAGDVQALEPGMQDQVRRVDRAIQAYERRNDRGHVVYANVELPTWVNSSNRDGFVANHFHPGDVLEFDRYTAATHQMHETVAASTLRASQMVVLEMQTRRGAYLGQSDKKDDTGHLLPRGMRFEVAGITQADHTDRSGITRRHLVVQLRDTSETSERTPR